MPFTRAASLRSTVKTVVRQEHDELGTRLARLLDVGAHILLTDAERPLRHQPAGIGDRRIRKRLAEHRDFHAALFEHLHRREGRLIPFGVADIEREKRKTELLDQLPDPRFAVGEFPVAGHGIGLEQGHAVDHVLTLAAVRAQRALPGVPAVEKQDLVFPALGAHALDHRGQPVEAPDAAVGFASAAKSSVGQRIGRGRLRRNAEVLEKVRCR